MHAFTHEKTNTEKVWVNWNTLNIYSLLYSLGPSKEIINKCDKLKWVKRTLFLEAIFIENWIKHGNIKVSK